MVAAKAYAFFAGTLTIISELTAQLIMCVYLNKVMGYKLAAIVF